MPQGLCTDVDAATDTVLRTSARALERTKAAQKSQPSSDMVKRHGAVYSRALVPNTCLQPRLQVKGCHVSEALYPALPQA